MVIEDYRYWTPVGQPQKKSSVKRILAVAVILMILLSTAGFVIRQFGPGSINADPVSVAILDSGIDQDISLQGRIIAEKSFVDFPYGYNERDLSTSDSRPDGVPHGTMIARLVAATANTMIINAKVMGDDGSAYTPALVDAIVWSVEQGARVVSMSLGASPNFGDPLQEISRWAFERGVVLVASAGNEGDYGILGTTINSPSVFEHVISVGALLENGAPAYFSSRGPTVDRYMKPDITADSWVSQGGSTYYGTSFSAPRVAAAAAELIGICTANNISYTPGAITAALLLGATPMPNYPEYVVGVGKLNVVASRNIILSNSQENGPPALSFVYPQTLPVKFEKLFQGDSYDFNIRLITSGYTTFTTQITSDTPSVFSIPSEITINQTTLLPVRLSIPDPSPATIEGTITFNSVDFGSTNLEFSFDVYEPVARVALDTSHSAWDIDSIFGQFRELYIQLTDNSISVTEIRNSSQLSLSYLQTFDAVAVLDPCSWGVNETNPYQLTAYSLPYSPTEIQAYEDYYNSGGGLFVVAMSNRSVNVDQVNSLLSWTGFSINHARVPLGEDPVLVNTIKSHVITTGVNAYHHLGTTLSIPMDGVSLASYGLGEVLGYKEGNGRLVVSGTNYFIDNYAFLGEYDDDYGQGQDALLSLRIFLWITGLLSE